MSRDAVAGMLAILADEDPDGYATDEELAEIAAREAARPRWRKTKCKSGLAATRSRMIVHRVSELYCLVDDGRIWYSARWICDSNSPSSRSDVVLIGGAEAHGGICPRCESLFAGWAVYRCYDADGQLLYIGSTGNRHGRLQGHEKRTPWWSQVARTEIHDHPDEAAARSAEHTAIATEKPLYNQRGNWKRSA